MWGLISGKWKWKWKWTILPYSWADNHFAPLGLVDDAAARNRVHTTTAGVCEEYIDEYEMIGMGTGIGILLS